MEEKKERLKIFLVWLIPIAMYLIFAVIYKANIFEILIDIAIIGFTSLLPLRLCLFAGENVSLAFFTAFLFMELPILTAAAFILQEIIVPGSDASSGVRNIIKSRAKNHPLVYSMLIFWAFYTLLTIILLFAFEIHAKLKK